MRAAAIVLGVLAAILVAVNATVLLRLETGRARGPDSSYEVEATRLNREVRELQTSNEELKAALDARYREAKEFSSQLDLETRLKWLFAVLRGERDQPEGVMAWEAFTEFGRLIAGRPRDPAGYANALKIGLETALKEVAPLNGEQRSKISALIGKLEKELIREFKKGSGPRTLRTLEIEAASLGPVWELLNANQRRALEEVGFADLIRMSSTVYLMTDVSIDEMADHWIRYYGMDREIRSKAMKEAERYLASIGFGASKEVLELPKGSPQWYRFRVSALRRQIEALDSLGEALTDEKRKRLRETGPMEVLYPDGGNFQRNVRLGVRK